MRLKSLLFLLTISLCSVDRSPLAQADEATKLQLPNIFSTHMVVQRDRENPIWGKAAANSDVSITTGDRKMDCKADENGMWRSTLPKLAAGGPYKIQVTCGSEKIELVDVLAGEVWICSGQSNMQWNVGNSEDFELEQLAANHPNIRMINFPNVGTQEMVWTHDKSWLRCNSETVKGYSAVGYFFARQLQDTLDVPIGMINNAWGGSSVEAWIDQDTLAADGRFDKLVQRWDASEKQVEELASQSKLNEKQQREQKQLQQRMSGNARPGNIYHGVLESHIGFGIKGAIWYQGESNANRAYQYRDLFPLMISQWREKWGEGDFPFYWVQLADYRTETDEPVDSDWAELREAQTMTLDKLAHVGEAVIIDLGEGKDIHPRNKVEVGRRLARLALKNDYGYNIAANAPRFASINVDGNTAVLTFNHVDGKWRPFDTATPHAFTIAGKDKKFYPAVAKIEDDNTIRVSSESVENPVAVRYAWADNPVVNLFNSHDLPLTPFRTDEWLGVTANNQ